MGQRDYVDLAVLAMSAYNLYVNAQMNLKLEKLRVYVLENFMPKE